RPSDPKSIRARRARAPPPVAATRAHRPLPRGRRDEVRAQPHPASYPRYADPRSWHQPLDASDEDALCADLLQLCDDAVDVARIDDGVGRDVVAAIQDVDDRGAVQAGEDALHLIERGARHVRHEVAFAL